MICYKIQRGKQPINEVFTQQEINDNEDKVILQYIDVIHVKDGIIPITNPVWNKNTCPFLNEDYTCNLMK